MVEGWVFCEAGERFREVLPGLVNWASSQGVAYTMTPTRRPDKLNAVGEELEAGAQHPGGECLQGSSHQGLQGAVVHDAADDWGPAEVIIQTSRCPTYPNSFRFNQT